MTGGRAEMRARLWRSAAVAAAIAVLLGSVGTAAASRMPAPGGGGGGPAWSHVTNAIPCNVPNHTTPGSCFVWSERLNEPAPYVVNLTDISTFTYVPPNESVNMSASYSVFTYAGGPNGTIALNAPLDAKVFVSFPAGNRTVLDTFNERICSNTSCWWDVTYSHHFVETPWDPADCTIEIGCNPN
jgi:hypothetical protein